MNNQHIGDLLITYTGQECSLPTRSSSPWQIDSQFPRSTLWTARPGENWHGFPLTTYQDDRWHIWVLGEFYGHPHPNLPHALETSADLNGHFVIFAYEKAPQRWHVLTDRFGTVHAYHASQGSRAALGTFSPAVAAAAKATNLDWHAIGGFFQFGFFLGNSTYWQQVRILNPATHAIFDADGQLITQRKTWAWHHQPDPNFNLTKSLDSFSDRFHQVIAEQVHDKAVDVPISGGLDSRSTLIPLTDQTLCQPEKLFCFSYGYSADSIETTIAKQLAQKRDLELTVWQIQPYLFEHLDQALGASEGFQDITLSRQVNVADQLGAQATHVLAAHWMDVWLDDMGFLGFDSPIPAHNLVTTMVKKFTKSGSQLLTPLFSGCLPANLDAYVHQTISDQVIDLHAIEDVDFKVKAWKTQAWSFRWTLASLRAYQLGLFPLVPFYDQRLADFFCQQPSLPMQGRAFQVEYLKRAAPDLARVPWQAYYDANLYEVSYFNTWLLPRRARNKLRRLISTRPTLQRNWEVQFLNASGRASLENWLLSPGLKLHNYADKNRLAAFLADFFARPVAANGYAASMLLTLSTWLEAYA